MDEQFFCLGAWVRYLIGQETDGSPVYRICEISSRSLLVYCYDDLSTAL